LMAALSSATVNSVFLGIIILVYNPKAIDFLF